MSAIGDIVRYGPGETALMLLEYVSPAKGKQGGLYFNGMGCMGLRARAHASQCRAANAHDMEIWTARVRHRGAASPYAVITWDGVRKIRMKLDLTRAELARWLMLAPANAHQTVTDWETGAKPVTGPASIALESFAAGFVPSHVRGGSSHRAGGVTKKHYTENDDV